LRNEDTTKESKFYQNNTGNRADPASLCRKREQDEGEIQKLRKLFKLSGLHRNPRRTHAINKIETGKLTEESSAREASELASASVCKVLLETATKKLLSLFLVWLRLGFVLGIEERMALLFSCLICAK
jgi:hypothetical protein